jgi:hypothetical protein
MYPKDICASVRKRKEKGKREKIKARKKKINYSDAQITSNS